MIRLHRIPIYKIRIQTGTRSSFKHAPPSNILMNQLTPFLVFTSFNINGQYGIEVIYLSVEDFFLDLILIENTDIKLCERDDIICRLDQEPSPAKLHIFPYSVITEKDLSQMSES